MAWNYGVRWLFVKVDSLCIVQMLNISAEMANEFSQLVRTIKELMR